MSAKPPSILSRGIDLRLALAAPRIAQIIGIVLRAAFRPAGGHRLTAIIAEHEAAQREVLADILACRSLRLAVHPVLNTLERLQADDRLMMPLAPGHAPVGRFDIPRIGDMR